MPESATNYLQYFWMPLFFVLSGYMFNTNKYISNFSLIFRKRFWSLLIPYFCLCNFLCILGNSKRSLYGMTHYLEY
ncbi:acyltransferase family protein [Virgibacillus sp. DJP39]|uniref:acyltransferase family protein n=1 Tax=Virgibacillus sp. DJP39 TaxID=3409790 RepID=UPI003BB7AC34